MKKINANTILTLLSLYVLIGCSQSMASEISHDMSPLEAPGIEAQSLRACATALLDLEQDREAACVSVRP